MNLPPQNLRTLSDADVEALAESLTDKLCARVKNEFYQDLGKGLWAFVWKCLLASMIGVAAYTGVKGIK